MKHKQFLKIIPIFSITFLFVFFVGNIIFFLIAKPEWDLKSIANCWLILNHSMCILAGIAIIYSVILWRKYDKDPFILLPLLFLNVFYMPFYYFRIKRIIIKEKSD